MADVHELLGLVGPATHPDSQGMGMHRRISDAELDAQPHPWSRSVPLPFEKAAPGEGSRGGHVIGHTRSGKPVYGPGHEAYKGAHSTFGTVSLARGSDAHEGRRALGHLRDTYPNYSTEDHEGAAEIHGKAGNENEANLHDLSGLAMHHDSSSSGIQNPNSSGQGHDASHSANPYHSQIQGAGFEYSHSTPIKRSHGGTEMRHTYAKPGSERKIGVMGHRWNSKSSSASGREISGSDAHSLAQHLKGMRKSLGASTIAKGIDLIAECAQFVIEKGGEGSHGGHVIGHTKSGKPIYAATHPAYHGDLEQTTRRMKQHYPDYSEQDHLDAAAAHDKPDTYLGDAAAHDHRGIAEDLRVASRHKTLRASAKNPE